MYNFSYFKEKDKAVLWQFMHDHPFVFLTGSFANGEQVATQIPVLVVEREGHWYIQGHIMRKTDHHKALEENPNMLAVFTGPHAYVSATWYTEQVSGSTWNYMSVHCKGGLKWMSEDELKDFMQRFTLHFEGGNKESRTVFNNLPSEYHTKMLPAIVGFELKVEEMENVFKLSQNRDEESYNTIMAKLREKGGEAAWVADEMEKRYDHLFSN